MPFISQRQVGSKLLSPQFLQGVNASDQGSPMEEEARPPDHSTEASTHPPTFQRGTEWGKLYETLVFKGVTNPKAGWRQKRAQRQCQPIKPHPVPHWDMGTQHECLSSFLLLPQQQASWKKWKAGFLLFSRGRRERKKTPQASGQLEATEPSGKESLAGLYDPISRWIVYF